MTAAPAGVPARSVILVRAVNVGGIVLTMDALRAVLADVGCARVQTLGASGNAVAEPPPGFNAEALEPRIEQALLRRAGLATGVFVRSAARWTALVAGNPFRTEAERDPAHLVAVVFKRSPEANGWSALRKSIVGRERLAPAGDHGYFVYPDGIGRSRLTLERIERHLGTRGTARNWNTVRRLALLAGA